MDSRNTSLLLTSLMPRSTWFLTLASFLVFCTASADRCFLLFVMLKWEDVQRTIQSCLSCNNISRHQCVQQATNFCNKFVTGTASPSFLNEHHTALGSNSNLKTWLRCFPHSTLSLLHRPGFTSRNETRWSFDSYLEAVDNNCNSRTKPIVKFLPHKLRSAFHPNRLFAASAGRSHFTKCVTATSEITTLKGCHCKLQR